MPRRHRLRRIALLALALSVACDGSSDDPGGRAGDVIEHVVIVVKENRTFDTYFGAYESPSGAPVDGATRGQAGPFEIDLLEGQDLSPYVMHEHFNALLAWNGGAMDGFWLEPVLYGAPFQLFNLEAYVQYDRDDLPNYWTLADRFVLADRYHSSALTSTFPNRLHWVAAQSGGLVQVPLSLDWNCGVRYDAAPIYDRDTCERSMMPPCWDMPVITDLLQEAGLSWKMYITPRDGEGTFNPLFAIRHVWDRVQADPAYADEHFPPLEQLVVDAAADALPHVSFVVYPNETSEHAPEGTVCCGEEESAEHLWALMESPAWEEMFVVLAWNDYGGYYDHVPPPEPQVCPMDNGFHEPGLRIPAIFISPYVRPGTVSHTLYEHASLIRGIEEIFGLGTLHERDRHAQDEEVNSVLDVLDVSSPDFSVPPRTPRTCPTSCLPPEA